MRKILSTAILGAMAICAACQTAQAKAITIDMAAASSFTLAISQNDNTFGQFVFGVGFAPGEDWRITWERIASLQGKSPLYLHLMTYNPIGPDGFIGTFTIDYGFTFANGTTKFSTNTTDWRALAAASNVPWVAPILPPQSYGPNGSAPWGSLSGIDAAALWIAPNSDTGSYAFFSTKLSPAAYASVPEPITGSIFAGGIACLCFLRRKENQRPFDRGQ